VALESALSGLSKETPRCPIWMSSRISSLYFFTAGLFVQSLAHAEVLVCRQADEVALFVDGARDVRLDPPDAVADELETAGVFERFDSADKSHGPFAHQVRQRNGASTVLDGHFEHKAHVSGNQPLAGNLVAFLGSLEQNLFFFSRKRCGATNIFKVTFKCGISRINMHCEKILSYNIHYFLSK
jgi:hypothetical protein